ncbi:hypothetical protein [Desulfobacter sp.]|jgi:UDP-N-acetylglucosamine pyrophosphorylase|uniref:hypothetical protein n=1 Tax=Desulfobacter sp. TaxID=2294 RepID=UPI000E88D0F7|nr:hypothetical protein [Desulfobacter sp.]MBP8829332.1 hypothetical protein [Desulfobacter sp.]HBT89916.1 hypothetical protein [Desulfobacter sp.]
MKQKIRFEKNIEDNILTVLESAEVDPGVILLLHEEDYALDVISAACKEGFQAFLNVFRRRSFFPTRELSEKLFENATEFFADPESDKMVIEHNDVDTLPGEEDFSLEEDDVELDALLDEDGDTKEDEMKEIDSEDDTPRFTPEDTSEHEN